MQSTETPQHLGGIVNYFQGATIHNIVINGSMIRKGREYYNESHKEKKKPGAYSDKQIAKAIEAICGEGKALDSKQKWAGVQWLLRWECNFPAKAKDFCERVATLPLREDLAFKCDYRNIREISTLSFLNEDPRQMDKVRYSKNGEAAFNQLKSVAVALEEQLLLH